MRVAVGDCSVTECRWWRPYQTGKTVHVHAEHYKRNKDGHTAPGVCCNGSVLLSHSGNIITRIGIHTHSKHCVKVNSLKYGGEIRNNAYFITQVFIHNWTVACILCLGLHCKTVLSCTLFNP